MARLVQRVLSVEGFSATLAGARIEADDDEVRFMREAGEVSRNGLRPLVLDAGQAGVWDGRFEITAERPVAVRAARGLRPRLSSADRRVLASLPARARDVVPIALEEGAQPRLASARSLALDRLLAACGAVEREPL